MAAAARKAEEKQQKNKGLSDTQRWVIGVILFAFALFLLTAVGAYYFYWADDQNFVRCGDFSSWNGGDVLNPAGKLGAVLADLVVGRWFGVFGVVIPVVLMILALRIINYRPMFLRKSVRISLVIMILGSLSLGFLFGTRWDIFGSGLGGSHGILVAEWIKGYLGVAGTALLLLLGWILIAVYINRRTISVVNKVGKGLYDSSVKMGERVIEQASELVPHRDHAVSEENAEEKPTAEPFPGSTTDVVTSDGEARSADSFAERNSVADRGTGVEMEVVSATGKDAASETNFEVSDSRLEVEENGVFTVIGPARPSVAAAERSEETQKSEEDSNVVLFGQAVDPVVGRSSAEPDHAGGRIEPTSDFEVVDRTSGKSLSVGGVVEAATPGGVKPDSKLEVVVAGRRDVELDDDQIDDSIYDPTRELSKYQRPPVELLEDHSIDVQVTEEEIYENKNQIVRTLENFGISIDKIKATIGPTVTLYEIVPAAGVKISKIKNLEDDIALSLKALGIRIIAPMPGKGTVGIEVPNKDKEIVSMYSVVKTMRFQESKYELPVVLGKTISNETFVIDLAKMPHLLVAGATGQGKSVGLNAIITSLLYKKHPAELKFVLVDPKRVELSLYGKLEKHFLAKMASEEHAILTDTQKVVYTLNALCQEMSDRYELLRMAEVKKISEYNDKFTARRLNPKKGHRFLPYIVVVIDEFADMIMTAGREVETPITRLAQLARAVGIHLVIATQRPDVKVITGLIKANFPARIAFRVMSMVDSRTIIDQPGANQLIGRGDMLMSLNGELTRVQCAFIDTPEIERITEFISNQRGYPSAYELPDYTPEDSGNSPVKGADMGQIDPMFEDVARFVVQNQQGSTSSIQRRFSIGYNRAGRIMDQLEMAGIVGKAEGSKPREVLLSDVQSLEYILNNLDS